MSDRISSLLKVYRTAALGDQNQLSQELWDTIPTSFHQLKDIVKQRQNKINFQSFEENVESLRTITTERHRKIGTLTSKVREALDLLDQGFIDVGHQPLLLGGQVFLINKVSLAEWIGNYLGMGCFFFIGDHDSIQNELIISRFPQANSFSGLIIKIEHEMNLTPIHQVPNPDEAWFQDVKGKIQDNLRLLMKMAKIRQDLRQLFVERFYSWYDLVYETALTANNFSLWTQKIWSYLFNIRNELRLFLSPSSDPAYRQLILPAYEFLLIEKNRLQYRETLNQIYDRLTAQNIQPGLPYREDSYVPFFLECLKCEAKTRIELKVIKPGTLEGKCSICQEKYSFSYNSSHPDLSEIGEDITPRSDSRAMVNSITFPLLVHIGGSGEVQYYSAVISAMKRFNIDPPIVIRSNRVYYNTPWGQRSAEDNNTPFLGQEVYSIFNEYNNSTDIKTAHSSLEKMRIIILKNYNELENQLKIKRSELETNPKNDQLRNQIKRIELMLSHNYGRFANGKNIQEVSWNWLDLVLLTGIQNVCKVFQQQIKEQAYPGHTWYVTLGKFT